MILTTLNSQYEVKAGIGGWLITKIKKMGGGDYLAVGETRVSEFMSLALGARARFDTWSTTPVQSIEN